MTKQWIRPGFTLKSAWFALLILEAVVFVVPERSRLSRLFLITAMPALVVGGTALFIKRRGVWWIPVVIFVALGGLLALPGHGYNREDLRRAYVQCLARYQGVPYLWGAETRLAVDCSGLVRQGLIQAEVRSGIRTLNPGLVRKGISLWWHDCSAKGLRDGYRGETAVRFEAPSINSIHNSRLQSGDLAVVLSGQHVLVYLGEDEWMEADPGYARVIRVHVPTPNNPWFKMPVYIVRWRVLATNSSGLGTAAL